MFALVWLLTCVGPGVDGEGRGLCESSSTPRFLALVWPLSGVRPGVSSEVTGMWESRPTMLTWVWLLTRVGSDVYSECVGTCE